jgi:hypothetical protein
MNGCELGIFEVYILWFDLCGLEFEILEFMIKGSGPLSLRL